MVKAQPDLPGYYFDPVRNKYFKLLKRHHGGEKRVSGTTSEVDDVRNSAKRRNVATKDTARSSEDGVLRLLRTRETSGSTSFSFQRQWMEALSFQPQICEYGDLGPGVISDVEQLSVDPSQGSGFPQMNVVMTGSKMGTIKLWEVIPSSSARHLDNVRKLSSRNVLPRQQLNLSGSQSLKTEQREAPFLLSLPASRELTTTITAVRRLQGSDNKNSAVVTGVGSSICGGVGSAGLFLLSLIQTDNGLLRSALKATYKPHMEMWTAESSPEGTTASIGLRNGAALISLEGGEMQVICRGDKVLAQEFDKAGNTISCGFKKGLIYDVDKRAAPVTVKHMRAEFVMDMKSPVCSILRLQSNEYHLLANSMDGQVKRWDRRNTRVPICSYEGNVNSSTMVQLGVDHAEALLFSGGEDHAIRIWSLTSGRLLHTRTELPGPITSMRRPIFTGWHASESEQVNFVVDHGWALWMAAEASPQSLFYMHSSSN